MSSNTIGVRDGLKLPVDIVRLVFDHAAALNPPRHGRRSLFASRKPSSHRTYVLGWITLTHVCHDWRTVGLKMPLLWASIATTFFNPSIASEFLIRAGSCPITVDLMARGLSSSVRDDEPMLSWIGENIAQVGVLKILTLTLYNTLRGGDDGPLPLLHTFHIEDRRNPLVYPLPTLQLHSTGLRSATLTDMILPSDSTRNLRHLDLTISTSVLASLSVIHEFLRCCPQLESLDFKVHSSSSRDEEYHAGRVQLNNLKSAMLLVDLERTAWDIWRPIIAADNIMLKIVCQDRDPALSRSTPLLFELCATQLGSEHHDAVQFEYNVMTVYRSSSERNSSSCTLASKQYGHAVLLDTFPTFIRKENIRTLSLDYVTMGTSQISDVFRPLGCALPSLTSLSLKHINQWPASLYIRTLGRGTPTSVFPALQILRVSDIDLKGISRDSARSLTQYWWNMVKVALKARSDATDGALRCLVLEGRWSNADWWDMEQDGEELRECRSRALVQVIDDHRTSYRTFTQRDA